MGDGDPKEENPLSFPPQGQPAIPEDVAGGASGGAPATNLDFPPSVRHDAGTEGGVKGLSEDRGPSEPPSPN